MSCEGVNVEGAAPRSVPPPLNSGERSIDQCMDRLRAGVPIPAALHTPTNARRDVSVKLRIGLIDGTGGRAPNCDAQCIRDLSSAQCPRRALALVLPRSALDPEMDLKGEHIMAS